MTLRISLSQFNAVVGDIQGNKNRMLELYEQARADGADVLVFPEMCLCGYPPEDLLLKKHFMEQNRRQLDAFAEKVGEMTVIAGFAESIEEMRFNSLAVIRRGCVQTIYRKVQLPNYGVFDERRYFQPGREPVFIERNGVRMVLSVCEDIWEIDWLRRFIGTSRRNDLLINISASPFNIGKLEQRIDVIRRCADTLNTTVAYCNLVGGQDELVFDGRSMFIDSSGGIVCKAKAFEEDTLIADIEPNSGGVSITPVKAAYIRPQSATVKPMEEIYRALVLGTGDYMRKNGFGKALIGLSGGIDSSLTAAIAVDALGAENVVGITMPSRFNSRDTISDAEILARNLGIEFHTIPIADILDTFNSALGRIPGWNDQGLAYENLQARVRGTLLMSLSNQFSALVLTTGNKSETAVGYSTLYGDTAGGYAVIKDVPKTLVYGLSTYVNERFEREVIPQSVIDRPPSAELRPDQKDSDSLPDYDVLDTILRGYVENDKSQQMLIDEGLNAELVKKIITLVDRNEYKRRQNPPGVRITPKAFGKDRRMPITNRFRA